MKKVNRLNYFKCIILICLLTTINSCKYFDHTQKYKQINFNSEFEFTVSSIESKNGYILNGEYYYAGGTFLQNGENLPKWISEGMDVDREIALFDEDGQILLDLWKIRPPFVIYKKANSNILYSVKNNDTLQFLISY